MKMKVPGRNNNVTSSGVRFGLEEMAKIIFHSIKVKALYDKSTQKIIKVGEAVMVKGEDK